MSSLERRKEARLSVPLEKRIQTIRIEWLALNENDDQHSENDDHRCENDGQHGENDG